MTKGETQQHRSCRKSISKKNEKFGGWNFCGYKKMKNFTEEIFEDDLIFIFKIFTKLISAGFG